MKLFGFENMKMNLLDGGTGGGGTPNPAPPSTPDGGTGGAPDTFVAPEWAKGLTVDPEILKAPMFTSVKTMDDVVKGYYHAQKMVGADKIVVPTKNSSPEEWKAFYQKGGLPEKIEDYKVEYPSLFNDQEFNSSLTQKAYELNIRPDQLNEIMNMVNGFGDKLVAGFDAEEAENIKSIADGLKKEWGQGFDKQIAQVNRVIKHFGGDEMHKAIIESDLANNGQFLRLMANISNKLLKEDSFMTEASQSFGMTKAEAMSKINAIMGDSNSPYHNENHAQHQEFVDKVLKYHEILAEQ